MSPYSVPCLWNHTIRLLPVLISLLLLFPSALTPRGKTFDFRNYLGLRAGQKFQVIIRNRNNVRENVGQGRIQTLDARNLALSLDISIYGRSIKGTINLKFQKQDRRHTSLRLKYSGNRNGGAENGTELVQADTFMANNGILTFKYRANRRFFQLSKNSRNENILATDWGTAKLAATN